MEYLWICFIVLAVGACIGSFLNVVALRALSKESIVFPASKCPKCSEPIKWFDNIPIFSYFFTFKGKCRNCNEPVSIQYPVIETLTAVIFLIIFISFGFTLKSLLLLILFSISIVITITDIKKEYIYECHAWILIITSIITSLYLNGINKYTITIIGLISGVIVMEGIAKLSYYLVRKRENNKKNEEENVDDNQKSTNINDEKFDINEYIKQNKRAFGEGDTYLAAASGALLGWKYFLTAMFLSVTFQALYLLPQFLKGLYIQKQYKLLISLLSFILTAIIYWILSNLIQISLYTAIAFIIVLLFFAFDTINRLKQNVNTSGFSAVPFGPAILVSTFVVLFFGENIIEFLIKHIFI